MKGLAAGSRALGSTRLRLRALAVLCLLSIGFQALGVGHWWGGHEIVTPDEAAEHASHCHGDTSSCGGGGVAVIDTALAGIQVLLGALNAEYQVGLKDERPYTDAYADVPDEPPRSLAS